MPWGSCVPGRGASWDSPGPPSTRHTSGERPALACVPQVKLPPGIKRHSKVPYSESQAEDAFFTSNPNKRPSWNDFSKFVAIVAATAWAPGRVGGLQPGTGEATGKQCVLRSSAVCG